MTRAASGRASRTTRGPSAGDVAGLSGVRRRRRRSSKWPTPPCRLAARTSLADSSCHDAWCACVHTMSQSPPLRPDSGGWITKYWHCSWRSGGMKTLAAQLRRLRIDAGGVPPVPATHVRKPVSRSRRRVSSLPLDAPLTAERRSVDGRGLALTVIAVAATMHPACAIHAGGAHSVHPRRAGVLCARSPRRTAFSACTSRGRSVRDSRSRFSWAPPPPRPTACGTMP